jgi:molecular chaperone GrpE
MVKKKKPGQEEPVGNKHDEPIDNKAYNNEEGDSGTEKQGNPPESETVTQSGNGPAQEVASSDKVVNGEKTSEEKLAEMQDRYIRLSAEFDNYRKRTLREKIELTKYAGENIILNILPVMDDFERAISLMDTATDREAMKRGIDLIYGKLTQFLQQNGVREIDSLNCDFNVDLHYAVSKTPVQEEDKKGKIVEVILKGYYLQDKVIRHSKVVIGE